MSEHPNICELIKLSETIMRTFIGLNNFRYPISGKDRLKFLNNSKSKQILQFRNFSVSTVVIRIDRQFVMGTEGSRGGSLVLVHFCDAVLARLCNWTLHLLSVC